MSIPVDGCVQTQRFIVVGEKVCSLQHHLLGTTGVLGDVEEAERHHRAQQDREADGDDPRPVAEGAVRPPGVVGVEGGLDGRAGPSATRSPINLLKNQVVHGAAHIFSICTQQKNFLKNKVLHGDEKIIYIYDINNKMNYCATRLNVFKTNT